MQRVYVMAESECGPCKIGMATNPFSRRSELQTGNPRRLRMWADWACADAASRERQLHEIFADRRIGGEWFNVVPFEVGNAISELCSEGEEWYRGWPCYKCRVATGIPEKSVSRLERKLKRALPNEPAGETTTAKVCTSTDVSRAAAGTLGIVGEKPKRDRRDYMRVFMREVYRPRVKARASNV